MPQSSQFPTGNATASGVWTNGNTGLNADDATKANFTTTTKNDVRTLTCGNFGFDAQIPADVVINQVDIELQNDGTSGGTQRAVIVVGGVDGASNDNSTGTETVRTFSNLARPGGGAWTRNDLLDGTLGVRVEGRQPNNTTSRNYAWDYVKVIVTYTLINPKTINNYQFVKVGDGMGCGSFRTTAKLQKIGNFRKVAFS